MKATANSNQKSLIETVRKAMAVLLAALIVGAALVTEAREIGLGDDHLGFDGQLVFEENSYGSPRDRIRRPDYPRHDDRDRRGRARLEEREVRVNRSYSRQSINLVQLFNLSREAVGTEIVSINVVVGRSDRTLLSLVVDNRLETSQTAYVGSNVLLPRRDLEIGRDFRFLQLDVPGSLHIESIRLTLAKEDGHSVPGGRLLEEVVNQRLANGQVLDLAHVMRLYAYRDQAIADIEIVGRTVGQYVGSVTFLVNNFREAEAALVPGQATRIFLRKPVEIYANSLLLRAQGDLIIERIKLRLERR